MIPLILKGLCVMTIGEFFIEAAWREADARGPFGVLSLMDYIPGVPGIENEDGDLVFEVSIPKGRSTVMVQADDGRWYER
jgi:hypothetical protein